MSPHLRYIPKGRETHDHSVDLEDIGKNTGGLGVHLPLWLLALNEKVQKLAVFQVTLNEQPGLLQHLGCISEKTSGPKADQGSLTFSGAPWHPLTTFYHSLHLCGKDSQLPGHKHSWAGPMSRPPDKGLAAVTTSAPDFL